MTARTLLHRVKALGRRAFPGIYKRHVERWKRDRRRLLAEVLSTGVPPKPLDDASLFESLQSRPRPPLKYDYDAYSAWKRGTERVATLLLQTPLRGVGLQVLELGCGDGMVGTALAAYGHRPTLLDREDWRDVRARALPFVRHDLSQPLPFADATFDLVCSYNTFEHIPDPATTLGELLRTVRHGGWVYLDFDPLYASAWGLHAWRTLHMPYPQFLFSDVFLQSQFKRLGLQDLGRSTDALQPLNRWRVEQFRKLWDDCGCQIVQRHEARDERFLGVVEEFPQAFRGRGLTLDDLTVHGICVLLRKPEPGLVLT